MERREQSKRRAFQNHSRGRVNPDYGIPVFALPRRGSSRQLFEQIGQLRPNTDFLILTRVGRQLLILEERGGLGGWIEIDSVILLQDE